MITQFKIKNYKPFKDFVVEGLSDVNLIVGKNGCGKTTFLEALQMWAESTTFDNGVQYSCSLVPSYLPPVKEIEHQLSSMVRADCVDLLTHVRYVMDYFMIRQRVDIFLSTLNIDQPLSSDIKYPVILSGLGSGVLRVIQILLVASSTKNGFLLIDGFGDGLHYTTHKKILSILYSFVKTNNIQLFMTTHSLDTVKAFEALCDEYDTQWKVLRLSIT